MPTTKKKTKKKTTTATFDARCGSLSIGKGTMRLGTTIAVADMTLEQAGWFFWGTQLEINIEPNDEQETLPGMEPEPVSATVESKGVRLGMEDYGLGFTFSRKSVPNGALDKLAHQPVRLSVERIGEATREDVDGQTTFDDDD